jgi:hypothetical protein
MKVFGRFNPFDFLCLLVVLVGLLGFALAKAGYAGVDQAILGPAKVNIEIYFVGLKTRDPNLFKEGEKSALTIRNQPVEPPMTITKVEHWPKRVAFPAPDGKKAVAFDDPTNPFAHDYVVTISDDAERTKDGYVVRGQKIKVGNQVELESFNYRVQGVVVNITGR